MKISKELQALFKRQQYELTGEHSAVKICTWTKKSLRDEEVCYKQQFYGIRSHLCCQMTPTLNYCSHSCIFCWRPIEYNQGMRIKELDNPDNIINNCIKLQRKLLSGFGGNEKVNMRKFKEAQNPKHFAISLSGEPTLYPQLPELIDELYKRKLTSFLVTNGTNPEMLKKLVKHQPTQLYITLPAPDKQTYERICKPAIKNGWEKIMESLDLLKNFNRSTIRLTLVKNLNMIKPKKYAEILNKFPADFVELKAYMFVGYSRQRLKQENMPLHSEIKDFANKIIKNSSLKLIDEKENSRVVLLAERDRPDRIMRF